MGDIQSLYHIDAHTQELAMVWKAKWSKGMGYWVIFWRGICVTKTRSMITIFPDIYGAKKWFYISPHIWELRSNVGLPLSLQPSPLRLGVCGCELLWPCSHLCLFSVSLSSQWSVCLWDLGPSPHTQHSLSVVCWHNLPLPMLTTCDQTRFLSHISQLVHLTNTPSPIAECRLSSLLLCNQ